MVKRAKLTLDQPEETRDEAQTSPEQKPRASKSRPRKETAVKQEPKKPSSLGTAVLLAGLTIASLVIFKRKIF
jgi:hypothetical protein